MWEAIRDNQRRSLILLLSLAALMVALGAAIGVSYDSYEWTAATGEGPRSAIEDFPWRGTLFGSVAAVLLWAILYFTAMAGGRDILLSTTGAFPVRKEMYPRLIHIVEEMSIASGMAKPPDVYVIDNDAPNAFAMGVDPNRSAVAVTTGLLRRLTRDELQGVIAHEIGHIVNRDSRFMTQAAIMVGAITILSDALMRSFFFRGRRSPRSGGGSPAGQLVALALIILLALLAPLAARLIYFACSRRREYLADAMAARFTRYPPGLASALEKIAGGHGDTQAVNRVVAPMYIVNPLDSRAATGLFSTHPPLEHRVHILRTMGGFANYTAYQKAFREVTHAAGGPIGAQSLGQDQRIPVREPQTEPAEDRQRAIRRSRDVTNLMDRVANFILIPCACGMTIKLPPDSKRESIECPRCARHHTAPVAEAAVATSIALEAARGAQDGQKKPDFSKRPLGGLFGALGDAHKNDKSTNTLTYQRKTNGWEAFKCPCGATIQISASFSAPRINCPKCRATIEVEPHGIA